MTEWMAQIAELPMVLLGVALGVIMVLDTIPLLGLLVPSDVVILAAIGARGTAGSGTVLLGVIGGGLAGFSSTFFVGRHYAAQIRASRLGAWIGESRWVAAERMLAQHGGRMVAVAPFLPIFNTLVPLAAGSLRMPYRRFLGAVAIGVGLWAGVLVSMATVAQLLSGLLPGDSFTTVATIVIGLAMGWFVMLGARRRFALAEVDTVEGEGDTDSVVEVTAPSMPVTVTFVPPAQAPKPISTVAAQLLRPRPVALTANGSSLRTLHSGEVGRWRSGGKRSGIRSGAAAQAGAWALASTGSGWPPSRAISATGSSGLRSRCSPRG